MLPVYFDPVNTFIESTLIWSLSEQFDMEIKPNTIMS